MAIGGGVTAAGLLVLSLLHGSQAEVVVGSLLLSIGVGFAFAAMPNLIVEAVPREQTGEATGFNTLLRNVGASLGSQVVGRDPGRQRRRLGARPSPATRRRSWSAR